MYLIFNFTIFFVTAYSGYERERADRFDFFSFQKHSEVSCAE
ncbi:MAG: hypothetical protein P4M11_14610 [Candidatus Pacebacteria bacterium]|nr:hypothetical protein [Candidatus Paceibacterota bacterium]